MGQSREENNESASTLLDARSLCLLSLDGGGVRGLSSLYVLKIIMQMLNDKLVRAGLEKKKPCQVFDLIGGTSTGGCVIFLHA